jgi:FAD/FMN-containing dehydrogenase
MTPIDRHEALKRALRGRMAAGGRFHLRKRTASNLFRYAPRRRAGAEIDLGGFNGVLGVDEPNRILDVEGFATFETIVDSTLPRGLAPPVTPELKHITIGGASVGIGIESNCHRHGFVHDSLLEAEVLLPTGDIVVATPGNAHADLFHALPNSYGTLGYILRAKARLVPAKPFVHLRTEAFGGIGAFLDAMRAATERADADFVEALMYAPDRLLLTVSRYMDDAPRADDITRRNVYYKLVDGQRDVWLTAKDYLFRYDPEWFWNIPESLPYRLFRRWAPHPLRHSGFYKRWLQLQERLGVRRDDGKELLIQDWEVPWDRAEELLRYAMESVDLDGKPWLAVAIRTPRTPTLYPIRPGVLYFNLGCYCRVRKQAGAEDFGATRAMDRKCFGLDGIKMLYSSTFMDEEEFSRRFNGEAFAALKAKYDPEGRFPTLYEKCVRSM